MNDAEKLEQADVLKKRAAELFKVRKRNTLTTLRKETAEIEVHYSALFMRTAVKIMLNSKEEQNPVHMHSFVFDVVGWSLSSCDQEVFDNCKLFGGSKLYRRRR